MAARSTEERRGGRTARASSRSVTGPGCSHPTRKTPHRDEHDGHAHAPGGHHAPEFRPLSRPLRRGAGRADPRRQAATRRLAPDPRAPLSAGRGDPLRRPPRRQLQAQPARRGEPGLPRDRLLRRAFHGRDRRHPLARRGLGLSPRPVRRMQHGRHGRPGIGRGRLGGPLGDHRHRRHHARHLHQLVGRPQGLLRPPRRDRLHQLQRPRRARMVLRPPASRPLLPRSAPGPQHRPDDGRPARADARLESPRAPGRQHPREDRRQPGPALEGPLLGPPDVQARARRACSASGSPAAASSSIPNA